MVSMKVFLIMSWLFFFRSILHDPKVFNDPMEYQPERFLKDGKLNPDVMYQAIDQDSVAFGYGRRRVYPTYSLIYMLLSIFLGFVLEDT